MCFKNKWFVVGFVCYYANDTTVGVYRSVFAPTAVRRLDFRTHENFTLFQNYPNPFNPTTCISFLLSQRCYVSLKVFDSIGKEVATLVNETLEAGVHEVNFNALNFSSGMYSYSLAAGANILTKK